MPLSSLYKGWLALLLLLLLLMWALSLVSLDFPHLFPSLVFEVSCLHGYYFGLSKWRYGANPRFSRASLAIPARNLHAGAPAKKHRLSRAPPQTHSVDHRA
jgi:hypothetical protein